MADMTIDEGHYAQLQAAAKLLEQLNGDPKSRKHLTSAIKVQFPNTRTEEDIAEEFAAPIREEVKTSLSKVEEMLTKLTERETREAEQRSMQALQSSLDNVKQRYGFNDEGMDKIKALMVDRSIPDPEAAAALFEKLNPAPVVTRSSWEPDNYDIRNDAVENDVAGLFADPDRWADREVGKILLDIRSNNH